MEAIMLGERIRALRAERKLTVRQLAEGAGVSVGLISQVERGISDPSLQTLRAIAEVFGTPLFDLFAEPEGAPVAVVRVGQRMSVRSPRGDITYRRISTGSGKLELLEGVLQPHGCSSPEPWSHPAEECVVVTEGSLAVEVKQERYTLEVGDSCYFDSRLLHRYCNETDKPTTFTLAVTPPSY